MRKNIIFPFVFLGMLSFMPASAQSAILYFMPDAATILEGEILSVSVMIDTQGETIRDIRLYYSYPEDLLEPTVIDLSGSILQLFSEATGGGGFAAGGKVEIVGGASPPGFFGVEKVASVSFRAKASAGTAQFSFDADSAVENADGENILEFVSLEPATYILQEAPAPEESVPESDAESARKSGFPLFFVLVAVINLIIILAVVVFVKKMRQD